MRSRPHLAGAVVQCGEGGRLGLLPVKSPLGERAGAQRFESSKRLVPRRGERSGTDCDPRPRRSCGRRLAGGCQDESRLDVRRQVTRGPDGPARHALDVGQREGEAGGRDCRRVRVQTEPEAGDDGEETRPRAAGGPEEVGVLGPAAGDRPAVGGDSPDLQDVGTCRSPRTGVPAESAAQQEAAHRDGGAVAYGEGQVMRGESLDQVLPGDGGSHLGRCRRRVDAAVPQPCQVDQQAPVTELGAGPVVPAGARGNAQPLGACPGQGQGDVPLRGDLQDGLGKPLRHEPVPHRADSGRFVAGVTPSDQCPLHGARGRPFRHHDLLAWPGFIRPVGSVSGWSGRK